MTKWPADLVLRRPINDLQPYPKNARTHSEAQIEQISRSMREWGWTNPVLVDEAGGIIAGHGRVLAARKLGLSDVPVMIAEGWTEAQKAAYSLADNQLALNAGWDLDTLAGEVKGLSEWGFDLSLLGFDNIDALLAANSGTGGLTDPDAAPEAPANPVALPGDLWALGRHRLLCGDATKAEDTERVLSGVAPHLMVTDPPYGVNYSAGWRNDAMPAKNDPSRWRDGSGRATGLVTNDDRADWRQAWALFPGDVAYVWHAATKGHIVAESLQACGLDIRAQIVWAKNQLVISRGHYHPQHEPLYYAVRVRSAGHWAGDRKQTTLWHIDKPHKSDTGHSAQKPIECMKRPIENNSSPGQAVYDPFVGSGTTIIAAEMTGRSCHAIELDPAYVDVTIKRWQGFTGQSAKLGDKIFAEIEAERLSRAA